MDQSARETLSRHIDALRTGSSGKPTAEEFRERLEEFRNAALECGCAPFVETSALLVDALEALAPGDKETADRIVAYGIRVFSELQNYLFTSMEDGIDIAALRKGLSAAISGAPLTEAVPAPVSGPAAPEDGPFAPRVPVLDLSQGAGIITEFINEAEDHLSNAENSILVLESTPGKTDELDNIFRAFHTIKGVVGFLNYEDIKILTHEAETLMDMVRGGERQLDGCISEAILHSIDAVRTLMKLLREQVANNGVLTSPYYDISPVLTMLRRVIRNAPSGCGAAVPAAGKQEEAAPAGAMPEGIDETGMQAGQQKAAVLAGEVIKISTGRLDNLVDMVGELVIMGTQVIQNPRVKNSDDIKLSNDAAQLEKIIRNIQDISMTLRLVPIKPVFQKMIRLVRDLSKKANKEINVRLSGEETEIDKNIIDLVSDPLMHMVRNSIDHGIEDPATRQALGKAPAGTIELGACQKGGNIVIEIRDDGCGLNKHRILGKAREQGLVKEGEVLDDDRIFSLIFEPGFSTAEKVTEISGRGVGMDVVKRNVEKLRGRIEIASSEGKGSTFTIKLPLTLAIIDGMITEMGEERYILPISSIVKFVRPRKDDFTQPADRGEMVMVHGELLELLRLDRYFDVASRHKDLNDCTLCVVNSDYGPACIAVDEILGQQQVVIKNLGEWFHDSKFVAGGAVLGDGKVGLILDVNNMMSYARSAGVSGV